MDAHNFTVNSMNKEFINALSNVLTLALLQNEEMGKCSALGNLDVEVMKNKADINLVSKFLVAGEKANREMQS